MDLLDGHQKNLDLRALENVVIRGPAGIIDSVLSMDHVVTVMDKALSELTRDKYVIAGSKHDEIITYSIYKRDWGLPNGYDHVPTMNMWQSKTGAGIQIWCPHIHAYSITMVVNYNDARCMTSMDNTDHWHRVGEVLTSPGSHWIITSQAIVKNLI